MTEQKFRNAKLAGNPMTQQQDDRHLCSHQVTTLESEHLRFDIPG
jgi:hypothetical protein